MQLLRAIVSILVCVVLVPIGWGLALIVAILVSLGEMFRIRRLAMMGRLTNNLGVVYLIPTIGVSIRYDNRPHVRSHILSTTVTWLAWSVEVRL